MNELTNERIEQLEKLCVQLEIRIAYLETVDGLMRLPANPVDDMYRRNKCPSCEISFEGTMGYVCSRTDCPYGGSTSTSFPIDLNRGG